LLTLFGGYLVKIYAWKAILGREGILNSALQTIGLIDEPLTIFIYNSGAVIATLTHFLLPLAVLPIYGSLRAVEDDLIEAARDLGARRQRFAMWSCRLPAGNSHGLCALFPDRGRRLCDAALRRRHGHGDDRRFHRAAILPALRLADGQRHVLQHAGGVSHGDRLGGSRTARRSPAMNARISLAIWSLFGAAVVVFMLTPLVLLVLFSFGRNG
jgi:ABC-type Fe3+ transport system permease subunit